MDVARKAHKEGVSQFVFFSSMSVYGLEAGQIDGSTKPAPVTQYGRTKLAAEAELAALADEHFRMAILRPPMIYGRGCKGNYPRLASLIKRLRVFPRVQNERSMLYIDCLCQFMERLLESGEGGLYFPQNVTFVSTDALALEIARANGRWLWQPRGAGWLLALFSRRGGMVGKVFGSLTYDQTMSEAFRVDPQPSFEATIRATEGNP